MSTSPIDEIAAAIRRVDHLFQRAGMRPGDWSISINTFAAEDCLRFMPVGRDGPLHGGEQWTIAGIKIERPSETKPGGRERLAIRMTERGELARALEGMADKLRKGELL